MCVCVRVGRVLSIHCFQPITVATVSILSTHVNGMSSILLTATYRSPVSASGRAELEVNVHLGVYIMPTHCAVWPWSI